MKSIGLVALFAFALAPANGAIAQTSPVQQTEQSQAGANAALLYWQAFALMPQLGDEQLSLLELGADEQPTDKHRELVQRHALALEMLQRGGDISVCNWAMQLEQDLMNVTLPHLSQARQLVRAAFLRARLRLADGDARGAIDDLVAAMTLGRTLSNDPILVCLMIDLWTEETALDAIANHLEALEDQSRDHLSMRLNSLRARTAFSEFVKTDTHLMLETLERGVKAADPDKVRAAELGKDLDEVLSNCRQAREAAKKLVEIAANRDDRTIQRLTELEQQIEQSANPVVRLLTVKFSETYRRLVEQEERLERLRAQLAKNSAD